MSRANPLWGAPRIHGELLKLGIEISRSRINAADDVWLSAPIRICFSELDGADERTRTADLLITN